MYKVSKETYEKVLDACENKCVLCGRTNWLELHHICGRGKFLTDEPTNCVMLCHDCHHRQSSQQLETLQTYFKKD